MNCHDVQPELTGYHFGVIAPDTRGELEEHLLDCPQCLATFIGLKREIETAELTERPSAAARERLRRAVARELRGEPAARAWSWWERPLAFGFAGAAVAAAMLAVGVVSTGAGSAPRTLSVEPAPPAAVPSPID